jgi:hypothetical protein
VQNQRAETLLRGMIDRFAKKYTIRTRPEMLMRIRLVDPTIGH